MCTALLGAEASFLIWFTPQGEPLGFFHETAPAELKDLFIANLDPLFFAGEEISSWNLAGPDGPLIGKMLAPGMQERFRQGNIHRQLCEPHGHGDLIDMTALAGEHGRAGLSVWNRDGHPMTAAHAALLEPVQPMMERALRHVRADVRWKTASSAVPHLLVGARDNRLIAIDPEAERLLGDSHLLRQNFSASADRQSAPGFVELLLAQLGQGVEARIALPVVDGRLVCRATPTRVVVPWDGGDDLVLVTLELQVAEEVAQVDHVMALRLTPLQREIALFALRGAERAACRDHFGISNEALKKHVRAILQATGCASWDDLRKINC